MKVKESYQKVKSSSDEKTTLKVMRCSDNHWSFCQSEDIKIMQHCFNVMLSLYLSIDWFSG